MPFHVKHAGLPAAPRLVSCWAGVPGTRAAPPVSPYPAARYAVRVTHPRRVVAGIAVLALALVGSACGGIVRPQGWATPALDDSTAYVFLDRDRISAVDLAEGAGSRVLWTFPDSDNPETEDIDVEAAYGSPVIDGDTLYFAGHEGDVFALDAETGLPLWRFNAVTGSIVDGPTLAEDRLIFGTTEGKLYVLTTDGAEAPGWQGGKSVGDGVWAAPVVDGGNVYAATMDGTVRAYSLADGSEVWDEPFKAPAAVPALAMLDGTLFVPSFDKHVYLVDPATGDARFAEPFETNHWVWNTPAFEDGVAYFGDLDGFVYALDITTNEMTWAAPYEATDKVKSGPAISGDGLVVVDRAPVVHFLSLEDGSLRGTFPLAGDTVRADIRAGEEGRVFAINTDGELFEIDPETRTAAQVLVAGGS